MKIFSLLLFDILLQPISSEQFIKHSQVSVSVENNIIIHNKSKRSLFAYVRDWSQQRPVSRGSFFKIEPGQQIQRTVNLTLHTELFVIHDIKEKQEDAAPAERSYVCQLNRYKPSITSETLNRRKLVLKAVDSDSGAWFVLVPKQKKFSLFTPESKKRFTMDELIFRVISRSVWTRSISSVNFEGDGNVYITVELKNTTKDTITLIQDYETEQENITVIPPNHYCLTYISLESLKNPDTLLLGIDKIYYKLFFNALTDQSTIYIAVVRLTQPKKTGAVGVALVPYQDLSRTDYIYEANCPLDYNITADNILLHMC